MWNKRKIENGLKIWLTPTVSGITKNWKKKHYQGINKF